MIQPWMSTEITDEGVLTFSIKYHHLVCYDCNRYISTLNVIKFSMTTNSTTDPIETVSEELRTEIPGELDISNIKYEGPELVIYTETPQEFADRDGLLPHLASTVRKRITVRPASGSQMCPANAKPQILQLVPEKAGITNLQFYPPTGEVIIEAEKPGLVIGQRASTLREITQEVGWSPEVLRPPPMNSSTIDNIRNYLVEERKERQKFLEQVGKKIHREPMHDPEWVRVTTLGCCREVGRAGFIISTPETRILVDCGDKPGAEDEVPYLRYQKLIRFLILTLSW